ncbi:MAG: Hsp33 family molecular chaperone HslO [Kiritimatiellae bacterium]|nr:Hsp33 family molecular chaperone HslO [Kiritimatiellia bacterium]
MYALKNNDRRVKVFFPAVKLSMCFVDVTSSARELEQRHQAGPAAGLALGEALAGVALLGSALSEPDECVTLKLKVSGPLQGLLVETGFDGSLRGYPHIKRIPELDQMVSMPPFERIFGEEGSMEVIRSLPGQILSSASCAIKPVAVTEAIERYYDQSLQRLAAADVCAQRSGSILEGARGCLVECMPDGDEEAFDRVRQRFFDDTVYNNLLDGVSIETLCTALDLSEAKIERPKRLFFSCRCSHNRVLNMLAGLSAADLRELADAGKPVEIVCHMCGKRYSVTPEECRSILETKDGGAS